MDENRLLQSCYECRRSLALNGVRQKHFSYHYSPHPRCYFIITSGCDDVGIDGKIKAPEKRYNVEAPRLYGNSCQRGGNIVN